DERYRRYRLVDATAERGLRRSLERYGQLSPVVVCVQDGQCVLIDGFSEILAQSITNAVELNAVLLGATDGILFLDEIHLLHPVHQHALLQVLDKRRIFLSGGKSVQSIPVAPFTLVGGAVGAKAQCAGFDVGRFIPEDSGVAAFLGTPGVHGWDVKRKLIWLGTHSYMFRLPFARYMAAQSSGRTDIGHMARSAVQDSVGGQGPARSREHGQ
ncbi:MAG: sigma 54-interacting transcriptional regulator, partial [Planctomycetota bacterium]|nr:sigma 54-interacting transcriptional regulator [Planctomycetota bacterium]